MKEGIFFSCTMILLLFQGFYLLVNPTATWSFGIGAIIGLISSAIVIGVLAGISAVTIDLGEISTRLVLVTSAILNLMFSFTFSFNLGTASFSIPVGMGILYPTAWNIFANNTGDMLGYLGFIFITAVSVLMLICGILIGAGSGE